MARNYAFFEELAQGKKIFLLFSYLVAYRFSPHMNNNNINYTIRSAGFEDVAEIFSLIKSYPEELIPRSISDIMENIDRFIVCVDSSGVIGTVSWQILPEIGSPKTPSVEIKSVSVRNDRRGSGIGTVLVAKAIDQIRHLHPSQIVVLTFSPIFFGKLGFREIPKEAIMHRLYMGCLNCSKYDSPFTCPETAMILEL